MLICKEPQSAELKHLDVAMTIKGLSEDGMFEGYASLFEKTDRDGDVMAPGCFKKALAKLKKPSIVKMFRDHDRRQVIGAWQSIEEDAKGLKVKGQLALKVAAGLEAYELMKIDALEALSVGFMSVKSEPVAPNAFGRRFTEVDLLEISVVSIPALPQARITSVKALAEREEQHKQLIASLNKAANTFAEAAIIASINRARAALTSKGD